ncbi:hypothetical protein ACFSM9_03025, partial [Microvirga arabica]|uniref:hypothetical protein n=1 Tax=Microvirga arabica TaxID=1128671 RepID=UPI003626226E
MKRLRGQRAYCLWLPLLPSLLAMQFRRPQPRAKYSVGTHVGCAPMMVRTLSGVLLQRSKKALVAAS